MSGLSFPVLFGRSLICGGIDDESLWTSMFIRFGAPERESEIAYHATVSALAARRDAQAQAKVATSRQLAAGALLNLNDRLDVASLLAAEAFRTADTSEARNALLTTNQTNPQLLSYLHQSGSVPSVAFSPDGKMLVSAGADRMVHLWDAATRRPIGEPPRVHDKPVTDVKFSPDGKTLVSASYDNTLRLWDVATYRPLGEPLRGHTKHVLSVAFSPDGKMLASAGDDQTVRLWDVATRQPLGEPLHGHTDSVWSVMFSPDSKTLASARQPFRQGKAHKARPAR